MMQLYQDAMALVGHFGRPDLFITFTCNPNDSDIKDNLMKDQTVSDRPDIVARVFHIKMKKLIDVVVNEKIFGNVSSYVYVVEFQKRGLPHIHLLLTMKPEDKIRTADDVDKFIRAKLPKNRDKNTVYYDICTKFMIHGPCGKYNPNSPCMMEKNGKKICSKGFPKPFQEYTSVNEDGYAIYCRPNNGRFITVG